MCVYQIAFTNKKNFGKQAREPAWAAEQRTLHGLQSAEMKRFSENHTFSEKACRDCKVNLLLKLTKLSISNPKDVPLFPNHNMDVLFCVL
jgi:hypothetical protein